MHQHQEVLVGFENSQAQTRSNQRFTILPHQLSPYDTVNMVRTFVCFTLCCLNHPSSSDCKICSSMCCKAKWLMSLPTARWGVYLLQQTQSYSLTTIKDNKYIHSGLFASKDLRCMTSLLMPALTW